MSAIKFIYQAKVFPAKFKKELQNFVCYIVKDVFETEDKSFGTITYVFCDNAFIREYNVKFLNHDYSTDIITFHDTDEKGRIESEILISRDTVKENSRRFREPYEKEFVRVCIHGVLHLCGYKDKSKGEKAKMRKMENIYLKKFEKEIDAVVKDRIL